MENATCQICERKIKANTGVIAHHGYTRPGWGSQTRSCEGARELPYEVSRDIIPVAIKNYTAYLNLNKDNLATLMAGKPELTQSFKSSFHEPEVYTRPEGFNAVTALEGYSYDKYVSEFQKQVRQTQRNIEEIGRELTRLQNRYDNWVKLA